MPDSPYPIIKPVRSEHVRNGQKQVHCWGLLRHCLQCQENLLTLRNYVAIVNRKVYVVYAQMREQCYAPLAPSLDSHGNQLWF